MYKATACFDWLFHRAGIYVNVSWNTIEPLAVCKLWDSTLVITVHVHRTFESRALIKIYSEDIRYRIIHIAARLLQQDTVMNISKLKK